MRVEVRNLQRYLIGHCEVPESVWEPAWRTGYLHMYANPGSGEAPVCSPGQLSPAPASAMRWTFRVRWEERVDGPRDPGDRVETIHYIVVEHARSTDVLPGFEPYSPEHCTVRLASGGPILRTVNDPSRRIQEQETNTLDWVAGGNDISSSPQFYDGIAVPPSRTSTPLNEALDDAARVIDEVTPRVDTHSVVLEADGMVSLSNSQRERITTAMQDLAARYDNNLRSLYMNGNCIYRRDAETKKEKTPMAINSPGKREIEI